MPEEGLRKKSLIEDLDGEITWGGARHKNRKNFRHQRDFMSDYASIKFGFEK